MPDTNLSVGSYWVNVPNAIVPNGDPGLPRWHNFTNLQGLSQFREQQKWLVPDSTRKY